MTLDDFYFKQNEPNQSCLLVLRQNILTSDSRFTETIKYGMPCFCIGKRAICYLWTNKKSGWPYVLFVDGKLLKHPALLSGQRKRMQLLEIDPTSDIPTDWLKEILSEAVRLLKKDS